MASNNIGWRVESKPEWVTVNPSAGTGDNSGVTVSAIPSTNASEPQSGLVGEIIIESDNGQRVSIDVERCIKCETSTTISYGYVEINFEACDTSSRKTADVPYSSITVNSDCTSSITPSTSSVTFNELSGRNCSATSRSQIITAITAIRQDKAIAKGTQAGGCRDIECFGPCECTPSYTQKTPYPNVDGTGGTVTVTWNASYATSCDNPRCSAFTVNERVDIPCNSGAARTYTGTSTAYGAWSVSQASGTPGDCGICNRQCSDLIGISAHTIPANPTTDWVKFFSYEFDNRNLVSGGKHNGIAFYYEGTSHVFTGTGQFSSVTTTTDGILHCDFYISKNNIQINTGSTTRSEDLYTKQYRCADQSYAGKTGYTGMPASVACDPITLVITQAAAEQICNVTNISVANSSIELTGSSFSNKVTVSSNGNACTNKWYGYNVGTPNVQVSGNSGDNYTGTTTGTYRVHSDDDPTKTAEFTVTSPATGVVLNITVNAARDNEGHAYPWLMMNGAVPQEAYQGHVEGNLGTYAISITISPTVWVNDGGMYYCCGNFSGLQGIDFENIRNSQWSNLKIFNTNGIDVDNSQIYGNSPREDGGPQACNGSWH